MKIAKAIGRIFAKVPGYAVVRDRDRGRDAVSVETKTEDELLKGQKRLKLISTQREGFRNTTFSPASALQLQINIVGTTGGRVTVIGKDGKVDADATAAFRHWAKHAEFTRGSSLNELLQLLIIQLTHTGGDFIALLDCGELTGAANASLRLKIFEPDQIKNITEKEFAEKFPGKDENGNPLYRQIDGIVKDRFGRIVSAFVGESRTGDEFKTGEYLTMKPLAVPGLFEGSNWIHVGAFDRPNQTRGISPLVHVANTLADIASIQSSEVQAAKLNAALGILIKSTDDSTSFASSHGDGIDSDEVTEGAETSQGAPTNGLDDDAANAQAAKTASQRLMEGQSAVLDIPFGKNVESFKTDRPNLNAIELFDRMTDVSGTVLGMTQMYTRLKPQGSYSAARAEMVMVKPVFRKWQKMLERSILDWLAVRVLAALGFNVSDGVEDRLIWTWPELDNVDEGSYQTALQKKFTNGEANLIDIHGADTEAFLDRRAEETEMFHARGLLAPWEVMTNGAPIAPQTNGEENEDNGNG